MNLLLATVAAAAASLQSGSDVHLEGARLKRFLTTRGAAYVGRDVRWDVSGRSLTGRPLRRAGGWALFVVKRIGLLVRLNDPGLDELRRRGGLAVVRGRVRRVPKRRRKKGDPAFYVDVREVTRRVKR